MKFKIILPIFFLFIISFSYAQDLNFEKSPGILRLFTFMLSFTNEVSSFLRISLEISNARFSLKLQLSIFRTAGFFSFIDNDCWLIYEFKAALVN